MHRLHLMVLADYLPHPKKEENLQVLRNTEPEVEDEIEILLEEVNEVIVEIAEPRNIEEITLNGIVYRKGGKSTAWLNGSSSYEGSLSSEYFRINTGDIDSKKVSITVPDTSLEFELKVGQTYEPNDGRLLDIVKDDEIVTSKN